MARRKRSLRESRQLKCLLLCFDGWNFPECLEGYLNNPWRGNGRIRTILDGSWVTRVSVNREDYLTICLSPIYTIPGLCPGSLQSIPARNWVAKGPTMEKNDEKHISLGGWIDVQQLETEGLKTYRKDNGKGWARQFRSQRYVMKRTTGIPYLGI